ncbi:MAG: protease pro-enzyme activation domain-containing protein, partial [Terriglobales bacterium]
MARTPNISLFPESGTLILSFCALALVCLLWAGSEANAAVWLKTPLDGLVDLFYGGRIYVRHAGPETPMNILLWLSGSEHVDVPSESFYVTQVMESRYPETCEATAIYEFFAEHGMYALPGASENSIEVVGTAGQIESLLHVQVNEYERPHNPTNYARTYESEARPQVPPEMQAYVREITVAV